MWSFEKLKKRLYAVGSDGAGFKENQQEEKLTEAAILVPIVLKNGIPFVLLTVRSHNLASHPGDVALPGGKREAGDTSLVATALRETWEEIGLSEDNVTVLGLMPSFTTKHIHFPVTPVVGKVINFDNFNPKLNPLEVSETFILPLENFLKKECHQTKSIMYEEKDVTMDYFEFSEGRGYHIIWGVTAGVLTSVARLLFDRPIEFEYQDWLLNTCTNLNNIYKNSKL